MYLNKTHTVALVGEYVLIQPDLALRTQFQRNAVHLSTIVPHIEFKWEDVRDNVQCFGPGLITSGFVDWMKVSGCSTVWTEC